VATTANQPVLIMDDFNYPKSTH